MININLKGKKAVIFGVATKLSIAYSIAKSLHDAGVELILSYQDRAKEYVLEIAKELNATAIECDVVKPELVDSFFEQVKKKFGKFDYLVHSIAFAKKEHLQGKYFDVDLRGYSVAQEVSSFSLVMLTKKAYPLMNNEGSIIAMTYYGSEKHIPNYNVMGVAKAALEASVRYLAYDVGDKKIRINAISAGPIKTLAASGITGFDKILSHVKKHAPLHRNITTEEVGNTALFLLSDLGSGITGQVIYVDAGYSTSGMQPATLF
jgi:enoyl-[acyl-carrier protein] reductase I